MVTGRTKMKGFVKQMGLMFLCLVCLSLMLTQKVFAVSGISTDELVKSSEVIIAGKVEKASCHWSKGTVVTRATVKVSEVLVGSIDKKDIIVEYEGGKVGDLELKLTDAVSLTKGEEIILFLKTGQSKLNGTVFVIEGEAQGKYTVKNGIASKNGFTCEKNMDIVDNNIPVKELVAKIKTNQ
ncbi:MAG: hypothetical protein HQK98_02460 [Nitrospirae bacterium]|nr:hypothetical protein [Nitrospirota bacterium]